MNINIIEIEIEMIEYNKRDKIIIINPNNNIEIGIGKKQ